MKSRYLRECDRNQAIGKFKFVNCEFCVKRANKLECENYRKALDPDQILPEGQVDKVKFVTHPDNK